jgi:hypothetical protein
MKQKEPRVAKLPDGRYMIHYRKPRGYRGYYPPQLAEVKDGKIMLVHVKVSETLSPGLDVRLDLGDRYRKVRR